MRNIMQFGVGIVAAVTLAVAAHAAEPAEEAAKHLREAIEYLEQGKYGNARDAIEMAESKINQLELSDMKTIFPDPLPGWTAEEAEGGTAAAAFLGGGSNANRRYRHENGDTVQLGVYNTPAMVQGVLMMMSNPMVIGADPTAELTRVKGKRAMKKWSPDSNQGEVNTIYENQVLVQAKVTGSKKALDAAVEYLEAMEFSRLDAFLPE